MTEITNQRRWSLIGYIALIFACVVVVVAGAVGLGWLLYDHPAGTMTFLFLATFLTWLWKSLFRVERR